MNAADKNNPVQHLLGVVDQGEAIKLKVLHNAVVKAMTAYKDDSTSVKLRSWKDAENALAEEVERLQGKYSSSPGSISWQSFQDTTIRAEVLRFLQAMGYQVAKRSFYRACKEGKLKTGVNNQYTARTVKAYANTLPRVGTSGVPEEEHEGNLQNEKLQIDIERGKIARQQEEIKLARLQGSVVDRDALHLELASRGVALDAGFRQLVSEQALEWIVLAGGNTDKLAEFVDTLLQAWDTMIGKYATMDEFEVLFECEK